MTAPLMPKATAVWLVENTTLSFRQIAVFCELHELEVQAIADGDVAFNIIGISPIDNSQLTRDEIARCEADKSANLEASPVEYNVKAKNAKTKKMLSPSQRGDKPAAILWIIRNMPEIIDSQIVRLVGTTKKTIEAIRTGKYHDMANLKPKNPVAVGLCSEKDFDRALKISQSRSAPKPEKAKKVKKAPAAKKAKIAKPAEVGKEKAPKPVKAKAPVKKAPAAKKAPAKVKKATTKKTAAKKPAAKKKVKKK